MENYKNCQTNQRKQDKKTNFEFETPFFGHIDPRLLRLLVCVSQNQVSFSVIGPLASPLMNCLTTGCFALWISCGVPWPPPARGKASRCYRPLYTPNSCHGVTHDRRHFKLMAQIDDKMIDNVRGDRIDPGRRFVVKNNPWLHAQDPGQAHALFHPAAQF